MKRRCRADPEPAKLRRRNTITQKRRGLRNPSAADHKTQSDIAQLTRELDEVLARLRYARRARPASGDSEATPAATGHRLGHRPHSLLGTFGKVEIAVPRARLDTSDGKTTEWKSGALRAYQRRTLAGDALRAGCYLAGTNTRRVRRALSALFGAAVGKDTVSRVWRVGALPRPDGRRPFDRSVRETIR